jgi:hypothetical protein
MRDAKLVLCSAQEVTTDAVSENVINLGADDLQPGLTDLVVHIKVTTAFAGMDSGMNIQLRSAAAAALTSSPIILISRLFTSSQLALGKHYQMPIPPEKLDQYLGMYFDLVSEAASAGALDIWIGPPESDVL